MKLPQDTPWLRDPAGQRICKLIRDAGFEIYFVGGCVRNAVLGLPDSDIDMSTNARPERVVEIAASAGLKAVPTGIGHGTVTIVCEGKPFEVTTFRRDVSTDGRRAVVTFSEDIAEDARRRDFTMNALYATAEGKIVDPLGGLDDALNRRVRFIEDPAQRIKEDYLRILRFFRFSAWYSELSAGFDTDTLAAIAAQTEGLKALSAERLGQEMAKLLSAPDPGTALAVMHQTGVLHQILPGADEGFVLPIPHLESQLGAMPDWIARLAALGGDEAPNQLRLSKSDQKRFTTLREVGFSGEPLPEVAYRHGYSIAQAGLIIRASVAGHDLDPAMLEPLFVASHAQFPVSAKDLLSRFQGPELGEKLRDLEAKWIASGFTLTAEDLLR